jgi:uncharacterized HAD superfamily protein
MSRISFDFDGVLSTSQGQQLAARKISEGNEVWILTARQSEHRDAVDRIAKKLGIEPSHVKFTNGEDKWKYVERYNIDQHYDNNVEQITKINANTSAKGTWYNPK